MFSTLNITRKLCKTGIIRFTTRYASTRYIIPRRYCGTTSKSNSVLWDIDGKATVAHQEGSTTKYIYIHENGQVDMVDKEDPEKHATAHRIVKIIQNQENITQTKPDVIIDTKGENGNIPRTIEVNHEGRVAVWGPGDHFSVLEKESTYLTNRTGTNGTTTLYECPEMVLFDEFERSNGQRKTLKRISILKENNWPVFKTVHDNPPRRMFVGPNAYWFKVINLCLIALCCYNLFLIFKDISSPKKTIKENDERKKQCKDVIDKFATNLKNGIQPTVEEFCDAMAKYHEVAHVEDDVVSWLLSLPPLQIPKADIAKYIANLPISDQELIEAARKKFIFYRAKFDDVSLLLALIIAKQTTIFYNSLKTGGEEKHVPHDYIAMAVLYAKQLPQRV